MASGPVAVTFRVLVRAFVSYKIKIYRLSFIRLFTRKKVRKAESGKFSQAKTLESKLPLV